ncbi:MAG: nitrogenase iron-molybdenum cofactor biosynthesis protein NifE [Nitrospirae bacterium]|nr:nitrogenase iron-molybdenum cofactor biosynthesis protein NifE [Nitrospirota bacterium]
MKTDVDGKGTLMITNIDKLTEHGCTTGKKDKVCRSRGGESCAFDGAMIVLQPIADAAHLVHGPIACCGNSWEGRGTLSNVGKQHAVPLHKMGFTTDLNEMDIIYGAEKKLAAAIRETYEKVRPKAIFVYATCVSGLIGENIEAVCKKAAAELDVRVIPVNAPGFVGPKNLGNRIAGEVLLEHVIGTGEPPFSYLFSPANPPECGKRGESEAEGVTLKGETHGTINLIGEYNIAGDLWLVEPLLNKAGLRILSRITGNASFEEITWAHKAELNVVVCSRALINVAMAMEQKYGIPYVEVSFFGKTEMAKALRSIAYSLSRLNSLNGSDSFNRCTGMKSLNDRVETLIEREEKDLAEKLKPYGHLSGKKAVLYTGGVKSWSFISALQDLGLEIVAVGTKKSTAEDEEKMKEILGPDAPLVEDVTPKNLKNLLRDRNADVLVAGGRNQYLAVKEGYPFVDVNQERHIAYAGYDGLVNLAEQISSSIKFYEGLGASGSGIRRGTNPQTLNSNPLLINPLKHSASIGAAMALQGVHNALPVLHGAQGCTFLAKVLLTKHFREPIALAGTRLFAEDVVMGSDGSLEKTVRGFLGKNSPDVIGILTSGLTEVKGDDISAIVKSLNIQSGMSRVLEISTPDYAGGLETGYAKAVESLLGLAVSPVSVLHAPPVRGQINILAGSHLTPADFLELREIAEAFGLRPVILPDLSCLDGSRQGISPLSSGGTGIQEIAAMGSSAFTLAIGMSLKPAAELLKERFGIEYRIFEGIAGTKNTDRLMETLGMLGNMPVPRRIERQRKILVDAMRDAHIFFGGKKVCLALEPDHAVQTSQWLSEMGSDIPLTVLPAFSEAAELIKAQSVITGDLFSIDGAFDLLISSSHAEEAAERLGIPLLQAGFPFHKVIGNTNKITIGYRGTLSLIHEAANMLAKEVH